jgi:hypothetical protein
MGRGRKPAVPGGPPPLGLGLQVSYGLGSAAFGIGGVALSATLLQLFFNQVIGLPAVWVGAAIMVVIVIAAVIDPLIGLFSDRLRSPLGRRHTLMYASAAPAALGFHVMWRAPQGLPPDLGLAQLPIVALFNLVSIYSLRRYSLTRDPHERNAAILASRANSTLEDAPPETLAAHAQ